MERCPRTARCIKPAGHAGWCRKDGCVKEKKMTQDDLFASASVKLHQQLSGAGRTDSGRKREAKQQGQRRAGKLPASDEDEDEDEDDGEEEEEDWCARAKGGKRRAKSDDGGGVEYADYGMSRSERKALRERGRPAVGNDDEDEDEKPERVRASEPKWSGPLAKLPDLERIRLSRGVLEKWLLEPFFAALVPGCFVRIGRQIPGQRADGGTSTLYRAAEVVEVKDMADAAHGSYSFAGKQTRKYLHLEFGCQRSWYPMASISNGAFEELELLSWHMVREVAKLPMVTVVQILDRRAAITSAENYHYSEAEITRKVQQELSQKAQPMLTTRQKLLAQHGGGSSGGAAPSDLVAKPHKLRHNVFGQAIIEHS